MKTYPLLKKAPAHDSPEFIDYLRENNVVIYEDAYWIMIENCKYHTEKKPWYTAFWIGEYEEENGVVVHDWYTDIDTLWDRPWKDWNWLKKSADKQTVKRFHIHIYK
jgi:hypothetical protein